MKKRILSVLLTLAILAALGVPALAGGGADLRLNAPDSLPGVGQTFTVTVDISANPGFNAMELELSYNSAALKCTKASTGPASSGMLSAANTAYTANSAKVAGASADSLTDNGTIAKFTFEVIAPGESKLAVSSVMLSNASTELPVTVSGNQAAPTDGTPAPEQNLPQKAEDQSEAYRPAGSFRDVAPTYWGYAQIERAASLGLAAGFEDGTFHPDDSVTRAQFVLMLWRMAGKPAAQQKADFTDANASWYQDALSWASEHGYVTGTGSGRFNPDGKITRQEAMAILFRYNGSKSGAEMMFTSQYDKSFKDSGTIASWAKTAVYWAVYKELLTGVGESRIAPTAPATRAQIAVILLRYMDKFANEEDV